MQYLEQRTGDYALILLLASLAGTPFQLVTSAAIFKPTRKPLGLYAFGYASLHLLLFLWLDYAWVLPSIWRVISQKPYIWAGLAAWIILLPLAVTSTRGWKLRLKKNWKRLHRFVYAAGILAVVHFALNIKGDLLHLTGAFKMPLVAVIVLSILFLIRLPGIKSLILRLRGKIVSSEEPKKTE